MKALVTGGSGVVGGALIRHLVAAGDDVAALARSPAAAAKVEALGASAVHGDILDYAACSRAASGAGVVYHVAGLNDMCPGDPAALDRINGEGTRTVVRAAAAAGVPRLVLTSSAAAHEPAPTAYGRSKALGEAIAHAESGGSLELVIVAPTSVQGPGRADGTARLLAAVLDGSLGWLPNTSFSVIDIDDCAVAHRRAAIVGTPGATYLVSGAVVSVAEIGAVARRAGLADPGVRAIPAWLFRALIPVAWARPTIAGQRLCADALRAIVSPHEIDGHPAATALGFSYTPLSDTIRRFAEWIDSSRS